MEYITRLAGLLVLIFALNLYAQTTWTNGQSAKLVLGQSSFTASSYGVSPTRLRSPRGVCSDFTNKKLYIVDSGNHRVVRHDVSSGLSSRAAAEAVLGQSDLYSDSSGTTASSMNTPYNCVVGSGGTLFIVDKGNNRILRFDSAHTKANGASADGVLGQADFTSGSGNRGGTTAANTLFVPSDVTLDSSGNLYVADRTNQRVLRFDSAASKANGADADKVFGQADFTSSSANRGGTPTANSLFYPSGVALDSHGNLYIGDANNYRVLRFDSVTSKANGADADKVFGWNDPGFLDT